jgi:biopolymer transport protein ExbD
MKKYLSYVVVGCACAVVGFALCYFTELSPANKIIDAAKIPAPKSAVVAITHDGTLKLNGIAIGLPQLTASLGHKGATVIILADSHADAASVEGVVTACQKSGVTRLALHTVSAL